MQHVEHGALAEELERRLEGPETPATASALSEYLAEVRPEDIAEVLGDFSPDDTVRIFSAVPEDRQAEVLKEADPTSRTSLVASLTPALLARVVQRMPPDDATDVVEIVPGEIRPHLLSLLEPDTASEVEELLRFEPESAGGIMTSEFIAVRADERARDVLEMLQRALDKEVVSYVYVVDEENTLQGVVSIRELIAAAPEEAIGNFMHDEVIRAGVEEDQEEVANLARKYNLSSIPIVDARGRLVGVVTIDDIVDVISNEADEDIYRLAGHPARHPVQQRILRRALVRIPWLFLSLVSGFVIALLSFDDSVALASANEVHLLVAFIPLVIGISGGVGTQSATLIARGLATGEVDVSRTFRIFLQELAIGLAIGLFMGALVILFLFGLGLAGFLEISSRFPFGVGLGLATGILLSTISGTLVPLMCEAVRVDPALVAGPFVTSLSDVIGFIAFMTVGKLVVT